MSALLHVLNQLLMQRASYLVMIDDDVLLPPEFKLAIPLEKFDDPTVKAFAFTLTVENLRSKSGRLITLTNCQDLEYKMAGYIKTFQVCV